MSNILIVEDSSIQAEMLRRILIDAGYQVRVGRDGEEGYQLARSEVPDLVISDVTMPRVDGFELCTLLRNDEHLKSVPIILLTVMGDVQDVIKGLNAGADNYLTKPYDEQILLGRVAETLKSPVSSHQETRLDLQARLAGETIAIKAGPTQMLNLLVSTYSNSVAQNKALQTAQDELASLNAHLNEEVRRQAQVLLEAERKRTLEREQEMQNEANHLKQLQRVLIESVTAIAATVESRDPYTAGHQTRVADLALLIGEELQLTPHALEGLKLASVVHDVGKISIPTELLVKPGKLRATEFNLIKDHPQASYEILSNIKYPWPIAEMAWQHHERVDGSGYPQGLKDSEILIEAKILAVADVIESMATPRPYRKALGIEVALDEIRKGIGSKYDPEVARVARSIVERKLWVPM